MQIGRRSWKAVAAVLTIGLSTAVVVPVAAWGAASGTGHTVSMTEVAHGGFDPGLSSPNPCTGADIVSESGSGTVLQHITLFPAGDEAWGTFTQTGSITMTDTNAVSYSGHTTAWGGFNVNAQNQNSTFTFSLKLTGSDGSTIVARQVDHFTLNANGNVTTSFDTMTLTCG